MNRSVRVKIDEQNSDVLCARRIEIFLDEYEGGSGPIVGRAVFHPEWSHYSGDLCRARTMALRVELPLADAMSQSALDELLAAFVSAAQSQLGVLPDSENSDS